MMDEERPSSPTHLHTEDGPLTQVLSNNIPQLSPHLWYDTLAILFACSDGICSSQPYFSAPLPPYLLQLSCIHLLGFYHKAMSIYTVILEIPSFFFTRMLSWRPYRIYSSSVNYFVVVPCCLGPKHTVMRLSYLDPFNLISLFLF